MGSNTGQSDWVTPTALILGVGALAVGGYMLLKKKPEPAVVNIMQPLVNPGVVTLGDQIKVTCKVAMTSGSNFTGQIIVGIYEGSVLSTRGDLIEQKVFNDVAFKSGETTTVEFQTIVIGDVGRRDILVQVNQGQTKLEAREFDDAFTVSNQPSQKVSVTLLKPTAEPNPAQIGGIVYVTVPVKFEYGPENDVCLVTIILQEGSWLGSAGKEINRYTWQISVPSPGSIFDITEQFVVTGDAGRRDVTVVVEYGGQQIAKKQFDDVFIASNQPSSNLNVTLIKPTADPNPAQVNGGAWIKVPVKFNAGRQGDTCNVTIILQEGSWWFTPGTELNRNTWQVTIPAPGNTVEIPEFIAVGSKAGRRDVTVIVEYAGKQVANHQFDDVFYVN